LAPRDTTGGRFDEAEWTVRVDRQAFRPELFTIPRGEQVEWSHSPLRPKRSVVEYQPAARNLSARTSWNPSNARREHARFVNSRNSYGWLEEIAPELLERWARRISRGDLCNLEAFANALEGIGAFMV
jgi:hypothetical protein